MDYSSASIIEEPTCEWSIIIICSVSRYFDIQITFSPATTTLCYFGGNLAFEVSWFGQLVVSPCEIWEKIFSKLVLIPNPALPLIVLLSVNPCKVIISFKKFLNKKKFSKKCRSLFLWQKDDFLLMQTGLCQQALPQHHHHPNHIQTHKKWLKYFSGWIECGFYLQWIGRHRSVSQSDWFVEFANKIRPCATFQLLIFCGQCKISLLE